jgi:hypothetical protein
MKQARENKIFVHFSFPVCLEFGMKSNSDMKFETFILRQPVSDLLIFVGFVMPEL